MIAINIDGQIRVYSKLPKSWGNIHNLPKADPDLIYDLGFRDVVRPVVSDTQKLGAIEYDGVNDVFTYPVLDKTSEELETEAAQEKEIKAQKIKQEKIDKYVESQLSVEEMLNYYPEWTAAAYEIGLRRTYKGKTFENTVEGNTNAPDKGGWIEVK